MRLAWHDGIWGVAAAAILLLGAVALLAGRRSWRGKSWRWWAAGGMLPVVVAVAVCLAAAGVEWEFPRAAPVSILLDLSPSTRGSPWRSPEFVRRLAQRRLGNKKRVTVAALGASGAAPRLLQADVSVDDAAAWPAEWPGEIVNAAAAPAEPISLAATSADRGTPGATEQTSARWIFTDGLLDPRNAPLSTESVRRAWTVIPPGAVDVAVRDMRAKSTADGVEVLAQLRVVGPAGGAGDTSVRVTFLRDDRQMAQQTVAFHGVSALPLDSARWVSVSDSLGREERTGPHRYTAIARLLQGDREAGDPWPENDRGDCVWPGERSESTRLLFVGSAPPPASFGAVEYVPTERFFGDVRRWTAEGWQAIALDDVPAESLEGREPLSADAARALRQFVEETGGGMILLGEGHAFGPGHYGETGEGSAGNVLEQLSPVNSHFHGQPLLVVYVLDASASMNEPVAAGAGSAPEPGGGGGAIRKFALLSRAVEESASWLQPEDLVRVITFNDHAQQIFSGAAGLADTRAGRLKDMLQTVHPAGSTVLDTALPLVRKALEEGRHASGDTAHPLAILVTDGEIPAIDDAWTATVQMSQAKMLVVAPPASADSPLGRLTEHLGRAGAGRFIAANDAQVWPDVLFHEMAGQFRGDVEEGPFAYEVTTANGGKLEGQTHRLTRVWPKPEAVVPVKVRETAERPGYEPVVTAWAQRGLGRVGAVAVANDDSPAFLESYRQLLEKISGKSGDRRFQLDAARDSKGWLLTADGADPVSTSPDAGRFIDGESLTARLLGTDASFEVPMAQTAPGHYEARIGASGGLSAIVSRKNADGTSDLVGRVVTADVQTIEWPASMPPAQTLPGIELSASADDPATWNPAVDVAYSLATPLWLVALFAALTALLLRR